jgi:hypothetical protein
MAETVSTHRTGKSARREALMPTASEEARMRIAHVITLLAPIGRGSGTGDPISPKSSCATGPSTYGSLLR